MSVQLITDSTSYIDASMQKELNIKVIPLSVHFPDESFAENTVTNEYFYAKLRQVQMIPTSSQPSYGEMFNTFKEYLLKGQEVLGIFLSADMSGTYQTAVSAKENLLQEFPGAKIEIVDSRTNSMSLGLTVIGAAKLAQAGQTLAQMLPQVQQMVKNTHFYFIPATLEYLKKGGRIGGAAALVGSLLKVIPVLFVDKGKTAVYKSVRGTRAATECLLNILDQAHKNCGLDQIVVHHIDELKKAQELAEHILSHYSLPVLIQSIGPVIGVHVGPGALGIVFRTSFSRPPSI